MLKCGSKNKNDLKYDGRNQELSRKWSEKIIHKVKQNDRDGLYRQNQMTHPASPISER